MSRTVLEIKNLTVTIDLGSREVPIIDNLSLHIAEGEVMALIGESGCGKSLSALAVMRLIPKPLRVHPASDIRLDRQPLRQLSVPEMRRVRGDKIAMIFQDPMTSLNPVRRVGDQVAEVIHLHEPSTSRSDAKKRVIELFEQTGIPEAAARYSAFPHQLSGGLKQRVMIAMALALRPQVLIADEPTTALDVTVQAQILQLMRDLQRDFGTAIMLITHDLGVVNELADRVAVMYGGRIVEEAPRASLLKHSRHPYSQGLLASMPSAGRYGTDLPEIDGVVPRPGEGPMGCRFATRCPIAFAPCKDQRPAPFDAGPAHRAWCHAFADPALVDPDLDDQAKPQRDSE